MGGAAFVVWACWHTGAGESNEGEGVAYCFGDPCCKSHVATVRDLHRCEWSGAAEEGEVICCCGLAAQSHSAGINRWLGLENISRRWKSTLDFYCVCACHPPHCACGRCSDHGHRSHPLEQRGRWHHRCCWSSPSCSRDCFVA